MRKTIYVPSQEVWDRIKLEAEKGGLSVSQFLIRGIGPIPTKDISGEVLDLLRHIRGQVDRLCGVPKNILDSQEDLKKLAKQEETLRAKYKRLNPMDICPSCKNRNKDCVCGD